MFRSNAVQTVGSLDNNLTSQALHANADLSMGLPLSGKNKAIGGLNNLWAKSLILCHYTRHVGSISID